MTLSPLRRLQGAAFSAVHPKHQLHRRFASRLLSNCLLLVVESSKKSCRWMNHYWSLSYRANVPRGVVREDHTFPP